jgi:NAD(P)-dependent dehydrogenase (short-subunit alcohol dehydrogenase family)
MKLLDRLAFVVAMALTFPILISWYCEGWTTRFTSPSYTVNDIPDMHGKVVMVTGATSGIGRAIVAEMYKKGATVIATARDAQKAKNATRDTINEFNTSTAIVGRRTGIVYSQGKPQSTVKYDKNKFQNMLLDLSSFESIRRFAHAFRAKKLPLDVLILNAGVMHTEFSTTTEGFETHFGVNYLGHFLLVKLLMPVLLKSHTRIVIMSSTAHHAAYYPEGIRFNQLDNSDGYDFSAAYAQSQLALICFGYKLANEVAKLPVTSDSSALGDYVDSTRSGPALTVNMVHPGLVKTNLRRYLDEYYENHHIYRFLSFFRLAVDKAAMTSQQAALTPVSRPPPPPFAHLAYHVRECYC